MIPRCFVGVSRTNIKMPLHYSDPARSHFSILDRCCQFRNTLHAASSCKVILVFFFYYEKDLMMISPEWQIVWIHITADFSSDLNQIWVQTV